jgi:hypothetical protein
MFDLDKTNNPMLLFCGQLQFVTLAENEKALVPENGEIFATVLEALKVTYKTLDNCGRQSILLVQKSSNEDATSTYKTISIMTDSHQNIPL